MLKICRSKKFKLVKVMIKAIKYQPKQLKYQRFDQSKLKYHK